MKKLCVLAGLWLCSSILVSGQDVSTEDDLLLQIQSLEKRLEKKLEEFPLVEKDCNVLIGQAEKADQFSLSLEQAAWCRDNGMRECCFQILEKIEPGEKDSWKRVAWLKELAMAYLHFEELESVVDVIGQMLKYEQDETLLPWIRYVQAANSEFAWRFGESFRFAGEAMEALEAQGNPKLEAELSHLIGKTARNIYTVHPDKSMVHLQQALNVYRKEKDTARVISMLCFIGVNYALPKTLDKTADCLEEVMGLMRSNSSLMSRMEVIRLMAICFYIRDEQQAAEKWFRRALPLAKRHGRNALTENIYLCLADLSQRKGELLQGQSDMDSAVQYHNPILPAGFLYRERAELASELGRNSQAVDYYRTAFKEQLKHYNLRNTAELNEWETQLRTRQKEEALQRGQRENNLLIGLVIALAALLVLSTLASLQLRKRRKTLSEQNDTIEKQSKEIAALDKLKTQFYANVSHELRTPLTLIQGPLEQALRENKLPPAAQRYIQTAIGSSNRLLELVNQLLDLERINQRPARLRQTSLALEDWMYAWVAPYKIEMEIREQVYHESIELPARSSFLLDEEKLKKVLDNLISNAIKYTNDGGQISLEVGQQSGELIFSVSDTGPGIHEDDLPHIFNRYYQVRHRGMEPEAGFGIGLALASELAKTMNGSLRVLSRVGEGSQFTLRIPALESSPVKLEGYEAGTEPAKILGSRLQVLHNTKVLLVEDHTDLRTFVRSILEQEGMQVSTAVHGKAAISLLEKESLMPELIITDLMMPQMNGAELISYLKSSELYADIPVLVLTARPDARQELRSLRVGVDDYVMKPFQVSELLARITGLIENYRKRVSGPDGDEGNVESLKVVEGYQGEWLAELEAVVESSLDKSNLSLETLSRDMEISGRQLQRRLKTATGLTVTAYLKEYRFQRARQLIYSGEIDSVKQLAEMIGMRDVKYFSREFRSRFGKSPSELISSRFS